MTNSDQRPSGLLRPHHTTVVLLQRLVDMSSVVAAHVLAIGLYDQASWASSYTLSAVTAAVLFSLFAEAAGLYQGFRGVPLRVELGRVFGAWIGVASALLLIAFMTKQTEHFSRVAISLWFVSAPFLVSLPRVLGPPHPRGRASSRSQQPSGRGRRHDGDGRAGRAANHGHPVLGLRLVGIYEDRTRDRCHDLPDSLMESTGTFSDLVDHAKANEIDVVYCCLPLKAEERVGGLLGQLADTTASVYIVPDFFVFDLIHGRWTQLGDIPLVSVFETPFYGPDGWLKRLEDIVLGSLALLVAAIPMIFIAIGVKLTSKGPVFFRQRRYGLNGEVIDVLKFRSMTVMENDATVKQATKNDSRVTPFGRFLRRTSLDELPQLIHVVTGSMSLVGPRPHAVAHNELYRTRIHRYNAAPQGQARPDGVGAGQRVARRDGHPREDGKAHRARPRLHSALDAPFRPPHRSDDLLREVGPPERALRARPLRGPSRPLPGASEPPAAAFGWPRARPRLRRGAERGRPSSMAGRSPTVDVVPGGTRGAMAPPATAALPVPDATATREALERLDAPRRRGPPCSLPARRPRFPPPTGPPLGGRRGSCDGGSHGGSACGPRWPCPGGGPSRGR
jgi:putative colanic acid biosynthesis UDP-glucose lipid carrier transferase